MPDRWSWTLEQDQCVGCGICADVCRDRAITMSRDDAYPAPVADACVGCMECVVQCPTGAIEVESLDTALSPGTAESIY